jgi:DNA polymerase III, alpha subunit (gram-positive type)
LGGTGGGYIFNLSTKELASGQYLLSFYVGSDHSFFYTVKFEVK